MKLINTICRSLRLICKLLLPALFIMLLMIFGSCRAKKETHKEVSTVIETTQKDSSHTEVVNRAIDDKVYIPVPFIRTIKPECDTVCDEAMRRMLAKMEAYKKSGENWYRMYYNEKERRMEFEAQMAETRNVATATNEKHEIDKNKELIKEIPVPYVPDLIKWLAIIGAVAIVCLIIWLYLKIRQWLSRKKLPI